jgi:hypothetical protein
MSERENEIAELKKRMDQLEIVILDLADSRKRRDEKSKRRSDRHKNRGTNPKLEWLREDKEYQIWYDKFLAKLLAEGAVAPTDEEIESWFDV